MKKILRSIPIFIMIIILSGIVVSCKKSFLDVVPKGKLVAEKTTDYDLLLNDPRLMSYDGDDGQVLMGDEMAAFTTYFNAVQLRSNRLFRWQADIYQPDEVDKELTPTMQSLYAYNKIISEVMASTGGTDQQKRSLEAEAKASRAWIYFLLINYYGKPYHAATATTDPGFPIITKADVTETQFTRASVNSVYEFIVEDLTTAIPNLPVQTTHRLRMSKAAAEGLLGKVYLFMGKFSEALPLLNAAFSDLTQATIPIRLYDYNITLGTNGSFLPIGVDGPACPKALDLEENLFARVFQQPFERSAFVIHPQTAALFNSSDLRLKFYKNTPYPSGVPFPGGLLRRNIGDRLLNFGVILPELYLLRAECKARLNDLAGAVADVETLRTHRMPPADAPVPPAIAADQTALVKYILEERIREFAALGFRWFDSRRLSVDPLYNTTVRYTHDLYAETGAVVETFALQPERFVLRFSSRLMAQNPEMENNP